MRNKHARIPDPNSFVSCPGDRFHIEYASVVNDDGTVSLKECGKTDIQEFIQSFKNQTDMAYILKQIALGDNSVLTNKQPLYGDFTDAPKTMAEYQQRLINGQRAFMQLPLDVRNQYDHDVMKFMADMGSEKWLDAMKDFLPKKDVEEVNESMVIDNA